MLGVTPNRGTVSMVEVRFQFTPELLREYSNAALGNATELLKEASLLHKHGHVARVYFLAVASIEEIGKALQAFDAQGRNLADSAVASKLKRAMEDHSQKITAAFTAWLLASSNLPEAVMPAINLMIHLKHGREPSMYTDIRFDSSKVQVPAAVVREKAAYDCVRLAADCLAHAKKHVAEKTPEPRTRAQDQLFAMKSGQFQKIANTADFWWYYIAQFKSGQQDLAEVVIRYQEEYVTRGRRFKDANGE
ncbi:MAG: AbiV family abortive infection protein [Nanoarchaeota archaeon]